MIYLEDAAFFQLIWYSFDVSPPFKIGEAMVYKDDLSSWHDDKRNSRLAEILGLTDAVLQKASFEINEDEKDGVVRNLLVECIRQMRMMMWNRVTWNRMEM